MERQRPKENVNWWQRGAAVLLFVTGLDVVANALATKQVLIGAGAIIASKFVWDGSRS